MSRVISNTCTRPLSAPKIRLILFAVLLSVVFLVPGFIHNQWIAGPVVNASLIIAAMLLSPMQAVVLGLIPSTIALAVGLLPLPLAPMVPFIMIANAIFVLSFCFAGRSYFVGLALAALFKFGFLHLAVVFVMSRLLQAHLVSSLVTMMSWPQLATAIVGGFIAYPIIKKTKRA